LIDTGCVNQFNRITARFGGNFAIYHQNNFATEEKIVKILKTNAEPEMSAEPLNKPACANVSRKSRCKSYY